MIGLPFAHVGGIPIEETLGAFGPAFFVALGAAATRLRALGRRARGTPNHRQEKRA
jgi:hypothetical protein